MQPLPSYFPLTVERSSSSPGRGANNALTMSSVTASNVGGCEALGESFLKDMVKRGMRVMTTDEVRD